MRAAPILLVAVLGLGSCETLGEPSPQGGTVATTEEGEPSERPRVVADDMIDQAAAAVGLLGVNPLLVMPLVQLGHGLVGLFRRKKDPETA